METSDYKEVVPSAMAGERLDRAVCLVANISRSQASDLIAQGHVSIDGNVVEKTSHRLVEGAQIEFQVVSIPEVIEPDDSVEFEVVYEDDAIAVINKPAGLVVHPGAGNTSGTLVNGLLAKYPQIGSVGEKGRPGIVHRIDRETSGLLMVALTEEAHAALTQMLSERVIERTYAALVEGNVQNSIGAVDAPIARSATDLSLIHI